MNLKTYRSKRKYSNCVSYAVFFLFILVTQGFSIGFTSKLDDKSPYSPPAEMIVSENLFLNKNSGLLKSTNSPVDSKVEVDFEKRTVLLTKKAFGVEIWSYYYPELHNYILEQRSFSFLKQWHKKAINLSESEKHKKSGNAFEIDIPVNLPQWTERFTGKEGPKLTISGRRKIIFEGNSRWVPGSDPIGNGNNSLFPDLKMNQESDFRVRGTVGRLIDVEITQDTDAEGFGQQLQDQVKIHYKGEGDELEDDIIQEVEAGNTNMSLPNTEFSGYSDSHKGLFGIKLRAKIGDLNITSVVSQEKGESQKRVFRIGEGRKRNNKILDKDYIKYKYFFIDSTFATAYKKGQTTSSRIVEFMAFIHQKSGMYFQPQGNNVSDRLHAVETEPGKVLNFRILKEDVDYRIDRDAGYIALNSPMSSDDVLAVYYRLSSGEVFGDTSGLHEVKNDEEKQSAPLKLQIIKPQGQMDSTSKNWDLMWKNVYSTGFIDSKDAKDMKIEIFLNDTIDNQDGKLFTSLLGISDESNKLFIDNDSIFRLDRGELILPIRNNSMEPFNNGKILNQLNGRIYKSAENNDIESKYSINITAVSKKLDYDLGFNVIPNSEKVKLDGHILEKGRDYTIVYETGSLYLSTPQATPGKKIEVEYESESIFLAEQKIFLGSRLEYKLPVGDESFIGASVLYKSETISEKKAQVGREPYRKLLFDANAKISTSPQWMTSVVDAIPLVSSKGESKFEISGEIAHSNPNPNIKSDALLDDFEGSDLSYPLGINQTEWRMASPPGTIRPDTLIPGEFFWYNPTERVKRSEIWNIDDGNISYRNQRVDVLNLEFSPYNSEKSSWGGIMRSMPLGSNDLSKVGFLEITLKGDEGVISVDIGQISEDLSLDGGPTNRKLDTEDKLVDGRRDGNLDLDEDVGIDGKADKDEIYLRPNALRDGWDTLRYSNENRDPAGDNYNSQDPRNWNGSEGNIVAGEMYRMPESEDVNNSGFLDLMDKYFRYKIDLSDTTSDSTYYVKGTNHNGWRMYRIPIKNSSDYKIDTVSILGDAPNWSKMEFFRLTRSGVEDSTSTSLVQIAKMEFVSNQWQDIKTNTAVSDSSLLPTIKVSVVNTQENGNYKPADWVKLEKDPITKEDLREQSVALNFSNVQNGQTVIVERLLTKEFNFLDYSNVEFDLHGDKEYSDEDSVYFFIRFASSSKDYYEYRTKISNSWERKRLLLDAFSELKHKYLDNNPQSISCDTIASNGMGVFGNPQYTKIKTMYMGITVSNGSALSNVSGTVWVNELKLTGIRKANGWAGRASFESRFADFLTINGTAKYKDGNFINLGDQARMGNGISTIDGRLNGNIAIDKFLNSGWGVRIPLSVSITGNVSRPKYKPNQDVLLSEDNLSDMAGDVVNEIIGKEIMEQKNTAASEFQTKKMDRTVGLSYSKSSRSSNRFINFLADRSKIQYGYNAISSSQTAVLDTNNIHSGNLTYDLSPRNGPEFRPFAKLKFKYIPNFIKNFWIRPLPHQLNFNVVNADYSHQRRFDKRVEKMVLNDQRFNMDHKMNMSYSPFNHFNLRYDISLNRDFDNDIEDMLENGISETKSKIFSFDERWGKNMLLNNENSRVQTFSFDWSPSFLGWLTNRVDYYSDYKHNLNHHKNIDMDIKTRVKFNLGFRPVSMLRGVEKVFKSQEPIRLNVEKVRKALSKISLTNINANYTVSTSQITKQIDDIPLNRWDLIKYQTGFFDRNISQVFITGDIDNYSFGQAKYWSGDDISVHKNDNRKVTRTLSSNTGVRIFNNTSIRGSMSWSKNINLFNDVAKSSDSSIVFPEWRATLDNSSLGRIPGIRKKVRSLRFNTSFNYKKENVFKANGNNLVVGKIFNPLMEFNIMWKNGVRGQLRRRWERTQTNVYPDSTIKNHSEISDTMWISYRFKRERPLKILFWKPKVKNNLDISFGLGSLIRNDLKKEKGSKTGTTEDAIKIYNGGPSARYYFTNKIDGGFDINYRRTTFPTKGQKVEKSVLVRIWAEIRF